jgi:hypothetical protein
MKISITTDAGEVYAIFKRDEWGNWIEEGDGDNLGTDQQMFGTNPLTSFPEIVQQGLKWAEDEAP